VANGRTERRRKISRRIERMDGRDGVAEGMGGDESEVIMGLWISGGQIQR